MYFWKILGWMGCVCFLLTSCVTPNLSMRVGPKFSSDVTKTVVTSKEVSQTKLDVIIPVFDPGIPEDSAVLEEERIWPELRRAESVRFALQLKEELEKTGQFGAVRVTPNTEATGDIYVVGTIVESNGKDIEFDLSVYDITGEKWFSDTYDHEVSERFHDNIRNNGKDPYQPAFEQAAKDLAELLSNQKPADMAVLQSVTEMRFSANFSEEAFAEHLKVDGNKIELVSLPSDDDPMLKRTRAIRVRDQLYTDNLQSHYEEFNSKLSASYEIWQQQALKEEIALEEAENKKIGQAILGGLLLLGAIGLAAAGGNSGNSGRQNAAFAGGMIAGAGGALLIGESFRTSEESKFHKETLEELGKSIDQEVAPQVVEFEGKTKQITGDAAAQFAEWRAFLKEIFEQEQTPAKQL
ncbi:hypothetical protein [Sneathiella aquimaris]|uniref:hypothetical protein n=1 Tax=Sneathiella aquimaris TaxID=2599305 RepID=UPI00146E960F|nr:hypothetical protein [Sneathiella aquimaris]